MFWHTFCEICTVKLISNWPLYKIWYCATYVINVSEVWLLCIVYTNLSINRKKTLLHIQNCRCGTEVVKIGYVFGLLVHVKVVLEFGRKLFLVDCLLCKTLNMAKISVTERTPAYWCTWKKHNSDEYRNYVIRSVLLLHIRAILGMRLARDYALCHADRS